MAVENKFSHISGKMDEMMLNVFKEAISETVKDAQTPVAKGGKMRVDTGFLRWSGVARLNEMPEGESQGRERSLQDPQGVLKEYNGVQGTPLNDVLIKMKLGDTLFFGWTAKYANVREKYDVFMESAVQKFGDHVNKVVERVKQNDRK